MRFPTWIKFPTWMILFLIGVITGYIIGNWSFIARAASLFVVITIINIILWRHPTLLERDRADSGHG